MPETGLTKTVLMYGKYTGTEWNLQEVDKTGFGGSDSCLVLDSSNNPHISYTDDEGNVNLKYASWNGVEWNIQTVDSTRNVRYSRLV